MLTLLIGLLFCHYLADFTHLSLPYMLKAKAIGRPLRPILDHALVHGALMFWFVWWQIDIVVGSGVWFIVVLTHFGIDVFKGRLSAKYPSLANPSNPFYWYMFGADQLLHIVVIAVVSFIFAP